MIYHQLELGVFAPFVTTGQTKPFGTVFRYYAAAIDKVIPFYLGLVESAVDKLFNFMGPALRANFFLFEVFGFHR